MGFQDESSPTEAANCSMNTRMACKSQQGNNNNNNNGSAGSLVIRKSLAQTHEVEMPSEEECMRTFDDADINGDGQLCADEIGQLVLTIWPDFNNKPAIERAYKRSDLDQSGFIDRDEFEFFIRLLSYYNNLWSVFASTDENGDWKLSKDEFCNAAEDLGIKRKAEEVFDEICCSVEDDEDFVDFDEFCHWITSHTSSRRRAGGRVVDETSAQLLADAMMAFGEEDQSYLSRCFIQIRCSLDILKCISRASDEMIESWATAIHGSMSGENRGYHTVRRMFHISELVDAHQMLALTFGDVVDYAVDFGVPEYVGNALDDVYIVDNTDHVVIQPINEEKDPATALTMCIFGYHGGLSLVPRKPFSKFLSAVFAARTLQEILPLADIAKIVVCIFATGLHLLRDEGAAAVESFYVTLEKDKKTSFYRHHSSSNFDPNIGMAEDLVDNLHSKLVFANDVHSLGMTEEEIVNSIQRGVDSSNRDVGWIATDDIVEYFESCWSLLPEITPALRQRKLYTVADYHEGVKNLETFLSSLEVDTIFFSYRGLPSAYDVGVLAEKALHNQELGMIYTKVKTVSQCIIVALAEVTGGNVPIVYFKGDAGTNHEGERSDQLHDSIPILAREELARCNMTVYDILANGRKSKIGSTKSILSAFVYGKLGDRGIQKLMRYTHYPLKRKKAMAFLKALPKDVSIPIAEAVATITVGRYELLVDLIEELDMDEEDKEENQHSVPSETNNHAQKEVETNRSTKRHSIPFAQKFRNSLPNMTFPKYLTKVKTDRSQPLTKNKIEHSEVRAPKKVAFFENGIKMKIPTMKGRVFRGFLGKKKALRRSSH